MLHKCLDERDKVVVSLIVLELKKQASVLVPQVKLSELADAQDVNWAQVPTYGVVIFAPWCESTLSM